MSEIVDMLRLSADDMERNLGVVQHFDSHSLRRLACRIDNTMAELPRGKDGKPIHVGDTVYSKNGRAWHVRGITIGDMSKGDGRNILVTGDSGQWRDILPECLTHERPDSWERIADELERYAHDSCGEDEIDGATASTLVDFARRIRRLAEREGKR